MSDRSIPTFSLPETFPTNPVLVDLLPEFAEQWLRDLTVTWSAIKQSGDTEDLRRFGHTIKGSFLQFGFKHMSTVGIEIMQFADAADWEGAESRVIGLRHAMESLRDRVGHSS